MMSRLPEEVLAVIAQLLDIKTKRSLAMVCRDFARVAFTSFTVSWWTTDTVKVTAAGNADKTPDEVVDRLCRMLLRTTESRSAFVRLASRLEPHECMAWRRLDLDLTGHAASEIWLNTISLALPGLEALSLKATGFAPQTFLSNLRNLTYLSYDAERSSSHPWTTVRMDLSDLKHLTKLVVLRVCGDVTLDKIAMPSSLRDLAFDGSVTDSVGFLEQVHGVTRADFGCAAFEYPYIEDESEWQEMMDSSQPAVDALMAGWDELRHLTVSMFSDLFHSVSNLTTRLESLHLVHWEREEGARLVADIGLPRLVNLKSLTLEYFALVSEPGQEHALFDALGRLEDLRLTGFVTGGDLQIPVSKLTSLRHLTLINNPKDPVIVLDKFPDTLTSLHFGFDGAVGFFVPEYCSFVSLPEDLDLHSARNLEAVRFTSAVLHAKQCEIDYLHSLDDTYDDVVFIVV